MESGLDRWFTDGAAASALSQVDLRYDLDYQAALALADKALRSEALRRAKLRRSHAYQQLAQAAGAV